MRRIGGCVVVSLLAFSACADPSTEDTAERDESGEIVSGGNTGVFRLHLGDCIVLENDYVAELEAATLDDPGGGEISGFETVPCSQPHTAEVVLEDSDAFADLSDFPGQEELSEMAISLPEAAVFPEGLCVDAVDAYTGTEYADSSFDVLPLVPTEASWSKLRDRELICMGVTLDLESFGLLETTGSMAAD